MKILVRFLLIFTCMKLIVAKPQHLQEQQPFHLDPLNQPEYEYPPKDPAKRTLGSHRHYAFGKHVGIHPHGFKYVLGYSPINIKYVPVIKPVTVLKPVLQQSIRPSWKPVGPPIRHYLPPVHHHHVDHGWKPVAPVAPHKPWVDEHVHAVVEEPIVPVQQILPAPVPVKPFVPAKPIHNYYYFQTPVAKPALLPQVPFLHVARPQLGVLPLGATFPSPVLPAHTAPGLVHFPSAPALVPTHHPVFPGPIPPPAHIHPVAPPAHIHPVAPPAHIYPAPAFPIHQAPTFPLHTAPAFPVHSAPGFPVHVHPAPGPVYPPVHPAPPVHIHPAQHHPVPAPPPHPPVAVETHPHPALPPISVEFHGTNHFVPFNNQFPVTAVQEPVPVPVPRVPIPDLIVGRQPHALPFPPEVHTNFVPMVTHLHPINTPQVPNQVTHLQPIPAHHPPEVQDHGPQPPFNPQAAIQPGHTDLQVPLHLPHHPHFRQIHGFDNVPPSAQFPPFQNHGNFLRPSISLEPPLTHGHT